MYSFIQHRELPFVSTTSDRRTAGPRQPDCRGRNNVGKTALLEASVDALRDPTASRVGAATSDLWQRDLAEVIVRASCFADLFQAIPNCILTIRLSGRLNDPWHGNPWHAQLSQRQVPRSGNRLAVRCGQRCQGGRSPSESIFDNELLFEYVDDLGNPFPSRAWIETTQLPLDLPMPPGVQVEGNIAALRTERGPTSPDRASSIFMQSVARIAPQELAARFGRAEVNRFLRDVEETLMLVEPRLQRLVAVPLANGPTLLYADVGAERILPAALMGGGFARLMELTLAFAEVSNGSILVDEIENGLHYAVLQDVWGRINHLSQRFNVQVFATTHSYECIRAAHLASKADAFDDDLAFFRLQRDIQGRIECVPYDDPEAFDYAMEYGREVR